MINKLFYLSIFAIFATITAKAQTTLLTETFDGTSHGFTLNTADQGSFAGTGGSNYWIVNNSYAGGNGTFTCLGYPFGFSASATPNQPAGVTNGPNSKYMHITSSAAVTSGFSNACYMAADGFCNFDENNFTKMSADISTIGFDSVELSFYWLCAGGPQSFGEVYYSTNAGSSWTLVSGVTLNNQSSWTQRKITLPAFEQVSTLRFGFRFVNTTTSSAADPSLAVDDISIKGFVNGPVNNIAAPTFTGTAFCPGDVLNLNFTASGTYNAGNVFTAQLSNAAGSFASPVAIGQLTAQTAGTINATIPLGTAAGNGYRIRVVSSNPGTTGADNGVNITVAAGPIAGVASVGNDTICSGASTTVTLTGVSGTAIWEQSADGSSFAGSTYTGNSFNTSILSQSVYLRAIVQNSCGRDTSNVVFVHVNPTPSAAFTYFSGAFQNITFDNNTVGTFNTAVWNFGDGNDTSNTAASITHTYAAPGRYGVSLTVTNSFGCSSTYTDSVDIFATAVNSFENQAFNANVYPNPSNGTFNIELNIEKAQQLEINIIDINGRQIAQLFNAMINEGKQTISRTVELSPALYFIEIKGESGRQLSKLILR